MGFSGKNVDICRAYKWVNLSRWNCPYHHTSCSTYKILVQIPVLIFWPQDSRGFWRQKRQERQRKIVFVFYSLVKNGMFFLEASFSYFCKMLQVCSWCDDLGKLFLPFYYIILRRSHKYTLKISLACILGRFCQGHTKQTLLIIFPKPAMALLLFGIYV